MRGGHHLRRVAAAPGDLCARRVRKGALAVLVSGDPRAPPPEQAGLAAPRDRRRASRRARRRGRPAPLRSLAYAAAAHRRHPRQRRADDHRPVAPRHSHDHAHRPHLRGEGGDPAPVREPGGGAAGLPRSQLRDPQGDPGRLRGAAGDRGRPAPGAPPTDHAARGEVDPVGRARSLRALQVCLGVEPGAAAQAARRAHAQARGDTEPAGLRRDLSRDPAADRPRGRRAPERGPRGGHRRLPGGEGADPRGADRPGAHQGSAPLRGGDPGAGGPAPTGRDLPRTARNRKDVLRQGHRDGAPRDRDWWCPDRS